MFQHYVWTSAGVLAWHDSWLEFAQGPNVDAISQVTFSRANLLAGQFRWSRLAGSTGKHMFQSACWLVKVCWLAFCSNSGAMSSSSALTCLQDNADGANLPDALASICIYMFQPACWGAAVRRR